MNWTELIWCSFWQTNQWGSSNALQYAAYNSVNDYVTTRTYASTNGQSWARLARLLVSSLKTKSRHFSSVQVRRSVRAFTHRRLFTYSSLSITCPIAEITRPTAMWPVAMKKGFFLIIFRTWWRICTAYTHVCPKVYKLKMLLILLIKWRCRLAVE